MHLTHRRRAPAPRRHPAIRCAVLPPVSRSSAFCCCRLPSPAVWCAQGRPGAVSGGLSAGLPPALPAALSPPNPGPIPGCSENFFAARLARVKTLCYSLWLCCFRSLIFKNSQPIGVGALAERSKASEVRSHGKRRSLRLWPWGWCCASGAGPWGWGFECLINFVERTEKVIATY